MIQIWGEVQLREPFLRGSGLLFEKSTQSTIKLTNIFKVPHLYLLIYSNYLIQLRKRLDNKNEIA